MTRSLLRILFLLLIFASSPVIQPAEVQAQTTVRISNRSITIRGEEYLIHKVRKGETLYSISRAYNVSQEEIMKANSLTRDVLRNKQTLLIPTSKRQEGTSSAQTEPRSTETDEQRPDPVMEPVTPSIPPRNRGGLFGSRNKTPKQPTTTQKTESVKPGTTTSVTEPQTEEPDTLATIHPLTDTLSDGMNDEQPLEFGDGQLKEIDRDAPLDIAVLLPLQAGLKTNDRFSEFYKGILIGLNALKSEGISTNVRFHNTGASEDKVRTLVESGELQDADLIIGPVYAEAFDPIAEYASRTGTPVVSPLGAVGAADNPYVFEVSPVDDYTYRQILDRFSGRTGTPSAEANLVLIDHAEYPDTAALSVFEQALGDRASSLLFSGARSQSQAMDIRLNTALDKDHDNIVFVPVSRVDALEGILSHLSSINTTGKYRITVIGTPRWEWLSNLNLDLFYKLNVHYPASYHADRGNPAVAAFYSEYMSAFGSLPSPYSFRGYDVIRYFGGALKHFGSDMPDRIANRGYDPQLLQVGYDFRQSDDSGKYRNIAWPIVNYTPDYTIQVIR